MKLRVLGHLAKCAGRPLDGCIVSWLAESLRHLDNPPGASLHRPSHSRTFTHFGKCSAGVVGGRLAVGSRRRQNMATWPWRITPCRTLCGSYLIFGATGLNRVSGDSKRKAGISTGRAAPSPQVYEATGWCEPSPPTLPGGHRSSPSLSPHTQAALGQRKFCSKENGDQFCFQVQSVCRS